MAFVEDGVVPGLRQVGMGSFDRRRWWLHTVPGNLGPLRRTTGVFRVAGTCLQQEAIPQFRPSQLLDLGDTRLDPAARCGQESWKER